MLLGSIAATVVLGLPGFMALPILVGATYVQATYGFNL